MKKLILALLLFTGFAFAQTREYRLNNGSVWTDTLGYTNVDQTKDSVLILDVGLRFNWFRVAFEGNGNSPVDSLYVQAGYVRYSSVPGTRQTAQDTIWGSWLPVQDSLFNSIHVMINNSVGKDFLIYTPLAHLLRFSILNTRLDLVTRDCVITINAIKRWK